MRVDSVGTISDYGTKAIVPFSNKLAFKRATKYLLAFNVINDTNKEVLYYVRNTDNGIATLTVLNKANNTIATTKTGNYIPLNQRFGKDEMGFMPIKINAGATQHIELLVSGFNGNKPELETDIYSQAGYNEMYRVANQPTVSQGYIVVFFIGAIFLMLLFFLFMYIESKQVLYGRYALYLSLQFIYGLLRTNSNTLVGDYLLQYPMLKWSLISPIILLGVAGYAWFLNELLDLKKNRPSLHKHMRWVSYGLLAYSIIDWVIFYSFPNLAAQSISFFIIRIVLAFINIYILFSVVFFVKSSIKKYYIIGNSCFLIFGILAGIKEVNNIFIGTYLARLSNANWYMVGILLECIFFAFALGIRIKEVQQEKEKANAQLLEQMQVNQQLILDVNQQLETKVKERTAKVLEQEKKIEAAKLLETKTALEKKLSESRMQALRSRMNPHFLFNSLNSIKYFILKNENDTAAFYLNKFSKLLRQILEYSNQETISLQQELDTLVLYFEIESLRFDQSFAYQINVAKELQADSIQVPPLILQPYVENAIWHGLANSDNANKLCTVNVAKQNGHINISIADNGVGRRVAASIKENKFNKLHVESFGMKITEERIDIFNNGSSDILKVAVQDNVDGNNIAAGTTINITLKNT
jgi:sensor histidine kinase YesM